MKKKQTKSKVMKAWAVCDKDGIPYANSIYSSRRFAWDDLLVYPRNASTVKRVEIRVIQ